MNVLQALPKSPASNLRTSRIGIHTTNSTSSSLVHGEWLCRNARSMFIARSSSGCMQRVRRGQRDGLRINGRGRAGCYVTSATAWPAATTARRGHIDINAALRAAAGPRKNLNLPYSLSLLAQYMEDHSERLESRAIAHGAGRANSQAQAR